MSSDSVNVIVQNEQVARDRVKYVCAVLKKTLPIGPVAITLCRPAKSSEQERKYHAMIRDIQRCAFRGNSFDGVKALMIAEFAAEMKAQGTPLTHPGETVYSHRLKEWVTVRPSSKKFRKAEASAFIEFLYAIGVELEVTWGEEVLSFYSEFMETAA